MNIRAFLVVALASAISAEAQWRKPERAPSIFDPQPLPALSAGSFPGLEVRNEISSLYLALQYGTGKTDVVYLYLDAPKPDTVRDILQLYVPGPAGLERREPIRGSGATYPMRGGGGTIRGREFKLPLLETHYNDIRVRCAVVLASGFRETEQLHLDATVLMEAPPRRAQYRIGGLLHTYVSPTPDGIKPLSIFGEPRLRAGPGDFDRNKMSVSLRMGDLPVLPGNGMGKDIQVWLAPVGDPLPQRPMRIRWQDRPALGIRPHESLASEPARWREGVTYQYRAELDMGPLFGIVTNSGTFRAESKK